MTANSNILKKRFIRAVLFGTLFVIIFGFSACGDGNKNALESGVSVTDAHNTQSTATAQSTTTAAAVTAATPATTPATTAVTKTSSAKTESTTAAVTSASAAVKPDSDSLRAADILDSMSLEEKIGQMFIARCPTADAARLAGQYHLGGYILFARDFANETNQSAAAKIKSYQDASKINMLIAVDEEGGTVVRVSKYKNFRTHPFNSPLYVYSHGGVTALASDTREKSELLLSLGINTNFAPVCDLPDAISDYIYKRTLGTTLSNTVAGINAIVIQMSKSNMISVLKHFPGYGNNSDTHTGSAVDNRPYSDFLNEDFQPFITGIKAGGDCILVSHNIVNCMDSALPASLSPKVHEILRGELGFNGVIITDDLAMDALSKYSGAENSAVTAVKAGNDLICCTDFQSHIPAVISAVNSGEIPISQINESVLRILNLKLKHGII